MRAAESQPRRKESFKGRPLSSSLNCRLNVARATNTRRLAYATNQPVLSYYIMHYYLLIELLSVLTSLDPIPSEGNHAVFGNNCSPSNTIGHSSTFLLVEREEKEKRASFPRVSCHELVELSSVLFLFASLLPLKYSVRRKEHTR